MAASVKVGGSEFDGSKFKGSRFKAGNGRCVPRRTRTRGQAVEARPKNELTGTEPLCIFTELGRRALRAAGVEEMAGCFCAALRRTTRAVTQLYDAALRPHGLRATQLPILVAADRFGRVPLAAMAEKLGMDRTTLLRNVRPLVRRRLIEVATEEGSRRVEVRATRAGGALLGRVHPAWRRAQARVLAALEGVDWPGTLAALAEVGGKPRN
jgi:DNA-binding MarR family transcriptional regulator